MCLPPIDQGAPFVTIPRLADLFMQAVWCSIMAQSQLTLGWFQIEVVQAAQIIFVEEGAGAARMGRGLTAFTAGDGGRQDVDRFVLLPIEPPIEHEPIGITRRNETLHIRGRRPTRSTLAHRLTFGTGTGRERHDTLTAGASSERTVCTRPI